MQMLLSRNSTSVLGLDEFRSISLLGNWVNKGCYAFNTPMPYTPSSEVAQAASA
jgi:hypothetical protein